MRRAKDVMQNYNSLIQSIDSLSADIKSDERLHKSYLSEPNSPEVPKLKRRERPPNYYSPDLIAAKAQHSRNLYKTLCSKSKLNRKIMQ